MTTIGLYAFYNCIGLKSIEIPNSVTAIGSYAFYNCNEVTSVYYMGEITEWCKISFGDNNANPLGHYVSFYIDDKILLGDIVIEEGVTTIPSYTFNNSQITSIVIPGSVTSIGDEAFSSCESLSSVYYTGSITEWCKISFEGFSANPLNFSVSLYIGNEILSGDIVIEDGVTTIPSYTFCHSRITSIKLPESVTSIGWYAFYNCSELTGNLILPNNVTSIGKWAFYNCSGLTGNLILPETVIYIGSGAFSYCSGFTGELAIPQNIIEIWPSSFSYCSGLTGNIVIPDGIMTIGDQAFMQCSGLTGDLIIPNGITSIGSGAFAWCSGLTSVVIPDSVTNIGSMAFSGCSGLTSITVQAGNSVYHTENNCLIETASKKLLQGCNTSQIPSDGSIVSISTGAFTACSELTSIIIPESVTSIEGYVFANCSGLTSIIIPDSVITMGDYVFSNCTNLTNAIIGNGITSIGYSVFGYCNSLESITIPKSVKNIKLSAFQGCSQLESIYYTGSIAEWCQIFFENEYANPLYVGHNSQLYIDGEILSGDIIMEDNISQIPSDMFQNSQITSIVLPNTIAAIKKYTFHNCSSLTSIVLPKSVTSIEYYAFAGCWNLANVYYMGSADEWENISIDYNEYYLLRATRYYYSENEPAMNADGTEYNGNYWHYDEQGNLVVWKKVHVYDQEVVRDEYLKESATCTHKAIYYKSCACGVKGEETFEYGDLAAHTYGEWSVDKEATCTEEGIRERECSVCHGKQTETISALGHEYSDEWIVDKNATCTESGSKSHRCIRCGEKSEVTEIAAMGHTYGDWLQVLDPTCTDSGKKIHTCIICGHEETQVIEAVGHMYSPWWPIKEATCTESGMDVHVCAMCNHDETKETAALGHDYSTEWTIDIPVTCTESGSMSHHCERCDEKTNIVEIEATGHNYLSESNVCSSCGIIFGTDDYIIFEKVDDKNGYAISGAKLTSDTEVKIPSVYLDIPVISVKEGAFENVEYLINIVLPDTISSIGEYAFSYCSGLASITIGNGLKAVGESAFQECNSLEGVYITDIKAWCEILFATYESNPLTYAHKLYVNESLMTELILSEDIVRIEDYTFYNCEDLISISVSNGLKSIGTTPFWRCSQLESVYITDIKAWCEILFESNDSNPLFVGANLYLNGELVTDLVIPETVSEIGDRAFIQYDGLVSVEISSGVKSIGEWAFYGCNNLAEVVIPSSIINIEDWAFYECYGLQKVYISDMESWCQIEFDAAANPLSYGGELYLNNVLITDLKLSDKTESIGASAFEGYSHLTNVIIPDSVTHIGSGAFSECSGLKSVVIGNGVTSIGNFAFSGCGELTSLEFGNNVTSIGSSAFSSCSGLTNVIIPDGVTSISDRAFSGCSALISVTIGNSVTSIGSSAFSSCSGLTSVVIPDSVVSMGDSAFSECNALTSVTIGNGVTSIGSYVFSYCYGLTSIEIPNSVMNIGARAFYASGLLSIEIPNSVISIDSRAFVGCHRLVHIIVAEGNARYHSMGNCLIETATKTLVFGCKNSQIPSDGSVTNINEYAFYSCSGLTMVEIPDDVTNIGEYAFSGCGELTSLTIGKGVMDIGNSAFSDCNCLTNIYYEGTAEEWEQITIGSYNSGLTNATLYCYSKNEPALNADGTEYDGNYWHYDVDGITPIIWKKEN